MDIRPLGISNISFLQDAAESMLALLLTFVFYPIDDAYATPDSTSDAISNESFHQTSQILEAGFDDLSAAVGQWENPNFDLFVNSWQRFLDHPARTLRKNVALVFKSPAFWKFLRTLSISQRWPVPLTGGDTNPQIDSWVDFASAIIRVGEEHAPIVSLVDILDLTLRHLQLQRNIQCINLKGVVGLICKAIGIVVLNADSLDPFMEEKEDITTNVTLYSKVDATFRLLAELMESGTYLGLRFHAYCLVPWTDPANEAKLLLNKDILIHSVPFAELVSSVDSNILPFEYFDTEIWKRRLNRLYTLLDIPVPIGVRWTPMDSESSLNTINS